MFSGVADQEARDAQVEEVTLERGASPERPGQDAGQILELLPLSGSQAGTKMVGMRHYLSAWEAVCCLSDLVFAAFGVV